MANSVNIKDLEISFSDNTPIKDFCCNISSGEKVAIMGESGCGKSTLLHSIMGLTAIKSGEINLCGVEVKGANIDKVRRSVAWLPQQIELPISTAEELFKMHFKLKVNSHLKFNSETLLTLLKRVGLNGDILTREWGTLSGGERQRVLIVSAIMLERKVILLDEATSALDALSAKRVGELLSSLEGVTILAVTHDETFANLLGRVISL